MIKFDKNKARVSILSTLLSFPTIRNKDWSQSDDSAKIGDLVAMSCANPSKWYLSWVIDTRRNYGQEWLLESIEDGKLYWWSNVSLNYYDREEITKRPTWRWTDRQFKFWYRWNRACKNAYTFRPDFPEFGDDFSVELSVRRMFESEKIHTKKFRDWRKLLSRDMGKFWDECKAQ